MIVIWVIWPSEFVFFIRFTLAHHSKPMLNNFKPICSVNIFDICNQIYRTFFSTVFFIARKKMALLIRSSEIRRIVLSSISFNQTFAGAFYRLICFSLDESTIHFHIEDPFNCVTTKRFRCLAFQLFTNIFWNWSIRRNVRRWTKTVPKSIDSM